MELAQIVEERESYDLAQEPNPICGSMGRGFSGDPYGKHNPEGVFTRVITLGEKLKSVLPPKQTAVFELQKYGEHQSKPSPYKRLLGSKILGLKRQRSLLPLWWKICNGHRCKKRKLNILLVHEEGTDEEQDLLEQSIQTTQRRRRRNRWIITQISCGFHIF